MELLAALALPSSTHAPSVARRHLEDVGAAWPEEVLDAALLVVSEAVTNAVRYGTGRIELCVRVDDRFVRLEVSDEEPALPRRREPADDDLSDGGRGLHLLDALTVAWGAQPRAGGPGKTVWMEIARS